jgi:hypothetical protein
MAMAADETAAGTVPESPDARAAAFRKEVMDAKTVLAYAVASGFTTADGRKVDDATIARIEAAEDLLGQANLPDAKARADFESAYRDLTLLVAPITAETLCATSDDHPVRSWITLRIPALSESKMLFWKLVFWTILFVMIAFIGNLFVPAAGIAVPPTLEFAGSDLLKRLLQIIEPFTYGGIGACAYLLKACIGYIQRREFDPRRELEYCSRILLGVVAGGMVVLLIENLGGGGNATTALHVSAAALGLLAGYNTDFLFSAIERITAAILPKVGPDSTQQRPAAPTVAGGDVALIKDLVAQLAAVTDPDAKKTIQALIDKIRDRL